MDSWHDLSDESRRAAQLLYREGMYRNSISRSYFAAYAAVTSELEGKVTFPQGRGNPPHAGLTKYVQNALTGLPQGVRRDIRHRLRTLYRARISADYLPAACCDEQAAKQALRDAASIVKQLEVR